MQNIEAARERWKVLNGAMIDAWNRLTEAQAVVIARQSAAASGAGPGPTVEECEEAAQAFDVFSRVKRRMDELMDELMDEAFGE